MKHINRALSIVIVVALVASIQVSAAGNTSNPVLKITEVSEGVLASNTAYDLTVTVENIGSSYGEDVSLTLLPPADGPIVLTEQISYKNVAYVNPNVPIEVTYGIRVDSGADPGYYTMTLEGVMSNDDGDQVTYSEGFIVEVVKGDYEVDFEVVPVMSTSFTEDSEVTAAFILQNKGKGLASDVTIEFGDNQESGVYVVGDTDRYLGSFSSMKEVTFEMDILIDADVSGYTPLSFDVTYDSGLSIVTETVTTYVTVEGVSDTNLIIRSIDKSASNIVPGQKVTYTVVVENTSAIDADYVKVSVSQDEAVVPSSQSVIMIDQLRGGEEETVQFTMEATESAESQNYPIEFTVAYGDETTSQYSGVYITNDDDDEDEVVSQPRIVVTDFNISSDKIFVGDTFDINFNVKNTSGLKDVRNLKVIIETSTSGSSTEAFMPLNQSNSYFVGDLSMADIANIVMPMKVFANAEGKSYSLSISFEFEDLDGNFYEDSETISIPVYEKTELTVSDVRVGSTLDNGYTLEVDFYNTGKVDITNMMVDLEGDFITTNSNYYVGDFTTGRTDVYDVEIMGTAPDTISGKIIFTYDDTFGEEESYVKEFTIGEEEDTDSVGTDRTPPDTEGGANASARGGVGSDLTEEQRASMQNMSQEERMAYIQTIQEGEAPVEDGALPSWLIYGLGGAVILVLGAIAAMIVRRKRKAN